MRQTIQTVFHELGIDWLETNYNVPHCIQQLEEVLDVYHVACLTLPDNVTINAIAYFADKKLRLVASANDLPSYYVYHDGTWNRVNNVSIQFIGASWFTESRVASINAYLEERFHEAQANHT